MKNAFCFSLSGAGEKKKKKNFNEKIYPDEEKMLQKVA
jgi:hypothetical protein